MSRAQREFLDRTHPTFLLNVEVTGHGAAPGLVSAAAGGCWYADYHFWYSNFLGWHLVDQGFRLNWCSNGSTNTSRDISGEWYYGNFNWSVDKVLGDKALPNGSQARALLSVQYVAGLDHLVLCGVGIGYANGTYGNKYTCNIYG